MSAAGSACARDRMAKSEAVLAEAIGRTCRIDAARISVVRSNRRTLGLQITSEAHLVVRAPRRMSAKDILRFAEQKSDWIEKHMAQAQNSIAAAAALPKPDAEELAALAESARAVIPARAAHFAPLVGVHYNRITIRRQTTRWGSCSSRGNLSFNCLLMYTPPDVLDYVVVHELCHLKEMNHSTRFWQEVERILPDYRKQKRWLRENGAAILLFLCEIPKK